MATITKLKSAMPKRNGAKNGYQLVWDDSPNSPTWLAKAAFEDLREMNGSQHAPVFEAALEAGLEAKAAEDAEG